MSLIIPFQTPDGPHLSGGMQVAAPAPANNQVVTNQQSGKTSDSSMGVPPKNKPAPQGGCGGDNPMMSFGLLAVMLVVFYFFLIRPQQKRQKEHQNLLNALMKGDKVITTGGILGTIVTINDRLVTLEIADKTRVKVLRQYIQGKQLGNIESDGSSEGDVKKE